MHSSEKNSNLFSKRFLWGVATSAHQVEGGNHNQWTVWELENAKVKAAQAEYQFGDLGSWDQVKKQARTPENYVSGNLGNHYDNYLTDFELLEKMHMNAYRFSIEWSRVEPSEGVWDPKAMAHYKEYINELKKRDIEPIVTLFHFSLPVWFVEKGGFLKRSNAKYFARFAKKVMGEIGAKVKYVITINEPEVYALSSYYYQDWPPAANSRVLTWRVINNLAYAHKKATKALRELNRQYKISIAKNSSYFYPGDDAWLSQLSANIGQYFQDDYIIKKFIRSCDFLGVNYYRSRRVYGYRIHDSEKIVSDIGWAMAPGDIEYALERLYKKYSLPIMVTENGLADALDVNRKWWITQTILGMQNAIKSGVKLIGYLHWSLIDNFEWAYGKWPRFGLAEVDYATGKRTLRSSAKWFSGVIKKIRGL